MQALETIVSESDCSEDSIKTIIKDKVFPKTTVGGILFDFYAEVIIYFVKDRLIDCEKNITWLHFGYVKSNKRDPSFKTHGELDDKGIRGNHVLGLSKFLIKNKSLINDILEKIRMNCNETLTQKLGVGKKIINQTDIQSLNT